MSYTRTTTATHDREYAPLTCLLHRTFCLSLPSSCWKLCVFNFASCFHTFFFPNVVPFSCLVFAPFIFSYCLPPRLPLQVANVRTHVLPPVPDTYLVPGISYACICFVFQFGFWRRAIYDFRFFPLKFIYPSQNSWSLSCDHI